jgi:RNA polymerase sigma-70 factor (ECF subfamily)
MTSESGQASDAARGNGRRPVVYCLIPADLGSKLHGLLRSHFSEDPRVEVVVEQRGDDRRSGEERRQRQASPPRGVERRQVRAEAGRRVDERRAVAVAAEEAPPLPRRARRYSDRLAFVERLEPSTIHTEDTDTARLVTRFQAGDREAFKTVYSRYFDRIYGYLLVALESQEEAEDGTQQVFLKALEALPQYERRSQPFRAWLFTIARHHALDHLRRSGRVETADPEVLDRQRERNAINGEEELPILSAITDRDLVLFVNRLPLAQRQVLMLSFTADLSDRQIAAILDRTQENVRMLRSRALATLRDRLSAVGRGTKTRRRARIRARVREAPILRSRRWALSP